MNIKSILLFLSVISWSFAGYSGSSDNKANNFLVISDIHLNVLSTHLMDLSPATITILNDLDVTTFNSLISEVKRGIEKGTVSKPKFIVLLGDLVAHGLFSSEAVINNESYVFNSLKKNFPTTPILYTFGNNDSLFTDYGPFSDSDRSDALKSPYDVAMKNASWEDGFLSTGVMCHKTSSAYPCIMTEDIHNGYYSAYLEPKLELISINSVMFSPRRLKVTEQTGEDQLQWLRSELFKAQKNNDKVILTMHVPPGSNVYNNTLFWLPKENNAFLSIVNTFHDTIIGLLGAHTHKEELKIINNSKGNNIAGVYYTAALSTFHGNAPSIKTFFFSDSSGQWRLTNYETFYFLKQNDSPVLSRLYDYNSYYCAGQEKDLFECLGQVTVDKLNQYFSAGNQNFTEVMPFPKNIMCTIPTN